MNSLDHENRLNNRERTVLKVVVVGAGTMGAGIAYSAAAAGHDIQLVEQNQKFLDQGIARIEDYLTKGVTRGTITKDQANLIRGRVHGTIDYSKACANAELAVEAVYEDESVKSQVFGALDKSCPKSAILASNTSSISISKLARGTTRPEKVVGLHFFNPVPSMKLVEVIQGQKTSPETLKRAEDFAQTMGKTIVHSADRTGFIVNRSLMLFINESARLLDENVATPADIDKAFVLGANHPMGPLQLADFIGLDIVVDVLKVLEKEYGERFTPSPTLQRLVSEKKLGRKTKRGFYDY